MQGVVAGEELTEQKPPQTELWGSVGVTSKCLALLVQGPEVRDPSDDVSKSDGYERPRHLQVGEAVLLVDGMERLKEGEDE